MENKVYLMPGRGDKLNEFLGSFLVEMGFDVYGREILSDFARLHFPQQIEIIKNDLKTQFLYDESNLIGDSYGAYLLLHALVELAPFPGRIVKLGDVSHYLPADYIGDYGIHLTKPVFKTGLENL